MAMSSARRPGHHGYARRRHRHAVPGAVPPGKRLPQLGDAEPAGVAHQARADGANTGLGDGVGDRTVGFADGHVDDAAACGFEFLRARDDGNDVERFDVGHAGRCAVLETLRMIHGFRH